MPVCDSSKGLVAVDALAAVGFGVGGLAALSNDQGTGAVALVGAALFTAAALHGSGNADKCREAFADYSKEANASQAEQIGRTSSSRRRRYEVEEEPVVSARPVPMPARHLAPVAPAPAPVAAAPAVAPAPAPVAPTPAPVAPKPAPAPKPAQGDDWSQFWREVP